MRLSRASWVTSFVFVSFLVLTLARPASAATIFSQPYPGPAPGTVSDSGHGQLAADDFTLLTTSILTDFHWWGSYTSTPDPLTAPIDSFSLTFFPDLASLISATGGVTANLTNIVRTSIGDFTPAGNAIFSYTADFVTGLAFSPGTYVVLLVGNSGPQFFGWTDRPDGSAFVRLGGNWFVNTHGQAFEITGIAVPEPATLLLLGIGVVSAAARRRSTRRSNAPAMRISSALIVSPAQISSSKSDC